VLRDGIRVLSRDVAATTTREGRALSRYCDYVPQLAKIEAARRIARRTAEGPSSPGRPDTEVVRRHLLALGEALARLRRHARISSDELRRDADLRWAVERGLQLCAQNAMDVATHLAAAAGRDAPDYASALDRMAEIGALPADFARRFRAVAGFRNVLVHGCLDVDLVVARLLCERLEDFDLFAAHVERFLRRGED
jgi:uncharacterized protein YutE (UPF0331/DUF86 family)